MSRFARIAQFTFVRRRPTPSASARRLGSRPRLEILEDRRVLSTFTVLNNADHGAGSLRDAIVAAPGGATIDFARTLRGQIITLTTGELDISKDLTIQGLGAGALTISGNDASRVFNVASGASVTIADLTIAHGYSTGTLGTDFGFPYGGGGGILNQAGAHLTLDGDTLTNNHAAGAVGFTVLGGGLLNMASATVVSCNFLNNQVTGGGNPADSIGGGAGGGLDNFGGPSGGATLTMTNSTFSGNVVDSAGGGFYFGVGGALDNNAGLAGFIDLVSPFMPEPSTATVTNCVFSGNLATGGANADGQGGGVNNCGAGSVMTLAGCTINGNRALGGGGGDGVTTGDSEGVGGGIYNEGGCTLNVLGCTITHNQALGGNNTVLSTNDPIAGGAFGGGIANNYKSTLNISNSVIGGNRAQGGSMITQPGPGSVAVGGGITNSPHATMNMANCLVANNSAVAGAGGSGSNSALGGLQAGFAFGGGIDVSNNGSSATIIDSTISDNQAIGGAGGAGNNGGNGYGGGIGVEWTPFAGFSPGGSSLTLIDSDISHNQAVGGQGGAGADGGDGLGGGLFLSASGSSTVIASTIEHNDALGGKKGQRGHDGQGHGGGVADEVGSVFVADANTVIKHNQASTSGDDTFLAP